MRAFPHAVAVACFVLVTAAAPAHASESAAGGPALRQARSAWEKGSLDTAEPLYREALEKGGLAPADVLEGYVRLGSIRASNGKKDQAIAAFRAASILDSTFAVPSEAGPKGPAYAAQAKKDTAKIGSIQLSIKAPKEATSGKPFTVTASLDPAHVPIVARIGLVARDGTSGKEIVAEAKSADSVDLEVSSDLTMPSASILVRVDALDSHGNRLASAEERVRVPEGGVAAGGGGGSSSAKEPGASSSAGSGGDTTLRKGGGFWSSPWPYLIGGVALAGAGTAVYFGTRPSEQVSVGQVGVRSK
ncbi:MAG: hypothetical protein JWP87_4402 [Labilithrix sp.]|nr:hypothetical protein [Labilithrix sp.]